MHQESEEFLRSRGINGKIESSVDKDNGLVQSVEMIESANWDRLPTEIFSELIDMNNCIHFRLHGILNSVQRKPQRQSTLKVHSTGACFERLHTKFSGATDSKALRSTWMSDAIAMMFLVPMLLNAHYARGSGARCCTPSQRSTTPWRCQA